MVRDLLAAGRIANLPTVWTNVLVGAVLALAGSTTNLEGALLARLFVVMLAGSLLYVAGCFYNDYYDREWDAEHKPERAIPAGRLSEELLLQLIQILGVLGVVLSFILGFFSGLASLWIVLFVYVYTRLHKQTAFAILPMGLCRAGLYFLGFISVKEVLPEVEAFSLSVLSPTYLPALGLILYIAGITLVARSEATNSLPKGAKWLGLLFLSAPIFTHVIYTGTLAGSYGYLLGGIGLVLAGKILVEDSVGNFVSLCLASICLIDGFLLLNILPSEVHPVIGITILLVSFLLARTLQRVAPAT